LLWEVGVFFDAFQKRKASGGRRGVSSVWIQQIALYGQGRVSLALWCRAGLVFSKTWVKISDGSQLSAQFPWPPTEQPQQEHNKQESTTFILPYMDPTNSIVWARKRKSFIGSLVLCRVGFQQNLMGQKLVMDPSCQHNASSVGVKSSNYSSPGQEPFEMYHPKNCPHLDGKHAEKSVRSKEILPF
jgi:hypothetical protein